MCRKCTAAANEWYLMRKDDCTEGGIFFSVTCKGAVAQLDHFPSSLFIFKSIYLYIIFANIYFRIHTYTGLAHLKQSIVKRSSVNALGISNYKGYHSYL